jgi:hypothetical protein
VLCELLLNLRQSMCDARYVMTESCYNTCRSCWLMRSTLNKRREKTVRNIILQGGSTQRVRSTQLGAQCVVLVTFR